MAIDKHDFGPEEVESRLHGLFEAAKAEDEFEFGCTLLRVRGAEDAGWDPFGETDRMVGDLMGLMNAPVNPHTKVRLGLLLYSHLTEVGTIYDMIGNLSRVAAAERYVIDPFFDRYPRNRKGEPQFLSTLGRVRALKEMLRSIDQGPVAELLEWFFHASVRNAFVHADYALHLDQFRSRTEWFERGSIRSSDLPFDLLADLVNRVLTFYETFTREYDEQRSGYGDNKVVRGRIGGDGDYASVELLADAQRGLYGFRSLTNDATTCDEG